MCSVRVISFSSWVEQLQYYTGGCRTHFHIGLHSIITKAFHVVSTHTSQNTAECQSEHAVAVCVIMQTCACPSTSALTKLIGNNRYYRWGGGGGGGKGGGGGDGGVSGGGGTGR